MTRREFIKSLFTIGGLAALAAVFGEKLFSRWLPAEPHPVLYGCVDLITQPVYGGNFMSYTNPTPRRRRRRIRFAGRRYNEGSLNLDLALGPDVSMTVHKYVDGPDIIPAVA